MKGWIVLLLDLSASPPDAAGLRCSLRDHLEPLQVPEPRCSVTAAGGKQKLLRVELDGHDGPRVLAEVSDHTTSTQVPDLRRERLTKIKLWQNRILFSTCAQPTVLLS